MLYVYLLRRVGLSDSAKKGLKYGQKETTKSERGIKRQILSKLGFKAEAMKRDRQQRINFRSLIHSRNDDSSVCDNFRNPIFVAAEFYSIET